MAFVRIRTFKGRQYKYLQHSYRVGRKVKTRSIYLGPVIGSIASFIEANFKMEPGERAAALGWAKLEDETREKVAKEKEAAKVKENAPSRDEGAQPSSGTAEGNDVSGSDPS